MMYFVLGLFFFVIVLFICAFNIVLLKKTIYYKYNNKKITNFDYLMDYDGNWLFKNIEEEQFSDEIKKEYFFIEKINRIKFFKKIFYIFLVLFFIFLILMKVLKIV